MQQLPLFIPVSFGLIVLITGALLFRASRFSKPLLAIMISWVVIQSMLGIAGFYSNPEVLAGRFPVILGPILLLIAITFVTRKGRAFIDRFSTGALTLVHVIRIPVEVMLVWLCAYKLIPQAMTLHGSNFDIFSGVTAPIVYYFGFVKKMISHKVMIVWNLVCLALLVNVVTTAILALPGRAAFFGFDQPNVAVGNFPFVLLPAFLVPAVLFSMLAGIRLLMVKDRRTTMAMTAR